VKTLGYALGYTSGFQSLIYSIHAIVTFDRLSCFRIPLRRAPGAGRDTALAANTEGAIYKDNTVFCPFLHGTGWTGLHTPWVSAMKARHKNIGHTRQVIYQFWPYRYDLAKPGALRQIVFCLAMGFTAKAPDTAFDILINIVFAHWCPSKCG
jgi:hypothetical protein